AAFHGDIGQAANTLDAKAKEEQGAVLGDNENKRKQLRELGLAYRKKFGFKFLVFAQGKTADEMLKILEERLEASAVQELHAARTALWQIAKKRLLEHPPDRLIDGFQNILS